MSDPLNAPQDGAEPGAGRAASVTLRSRGPESETSAGLDPANQSLADALRITYMIVQLGMIVLIGLMVFSGARTVDEGQRGVSVVLGKIRQTDLEPGLHLSLPYPMGELVTLNTGAARVDVKRAFFPFVAPGDEDRPISGLRKADRLNPAQDGSMITADLNLAHSQWTVTYRRDNLNRFIENVSPGPDDQEERRIIRLAVQRGVVLATAETAIDDLLKSSGEVESRAGRLAQEMLERLDTGLRIEQLTLTRLPFAPVILKDDFEQVAAESNEAAEASERADQQRRQILNRVAGEAASALIERIDAYELATDLADEDAQARILRQIDALLEGHPVEIDGVEFDAELASGEVTEIISRAQNEADGILSWAQERKAIFLAKSEQFEANPSLLLVRDWSEAYTTFLSKPFVQQFHLPPGQDLEILLNKDPDIEDQFEKDRNRREAMDSAARREEQRRLERFRADEGIIDAEEGF